MVIVTTVEHDSWNDPYVKCLGVIEDDTYYEYKNWVEKKPFERIDFSLDFIVTNNLKDLTLDFIEKMK